MTNHFFLIFFSFFVSTNHADLENFGIYYFNLFKDNKVSEIYEHFSEISKISINYSDLEKLVIEISQSVGDIKSINSIMKEKWGQVLKFKIGHIVECYRDALGSPRKMPSETGILVITRI